MTSDSDELLVRRKYLTAREYGGSNWKNGVPFDDYWEILVDEPNGVVEVGRGKTIPLAWADAAKRLSGC